MRISNQPLTQMKFITAENCQIYSYVVLHLTSSATHLIVISVLVNIEQQALPVLIHSLRTRE
mgnify:FL=1